MITLQCCDEKYYADEQHIGRNIQCRKCGRVLTIGAAAPVRNTASSPQPRWTTAAFKKTRTVATRKIVFGSIAFVALALVVIVSRIGSKPPSTVAPVERPATVAPEGEVRPAATPKDSPQIPVVAGRADSRTTPTVPPATAAAPITPRSETPELTLPQPPVVSLRTGTWIMEPHGIAGRGVLIIRNGGGLDSAVKLVTASLPRKVFWIVYIRAHEERRVSAIAVGTYLLRFAMGRDWEAGTRRFLQDAQFYQAGRQLIFTETEPTEDHRGEYTELQLTLNEVVGGNLPRAGITQSVFNEGEPDN